ncbi:hypothetical protein DY000_02006598 [Brassica cretica]|uniref:Uncharacterized protein n=1 Tax=Brassica cretica TaxID=69181 RepID=A0ABQ7C5G7_BRACR|nr:hypothetical protein DY000_02006598 [Brassica cretica]
MVPTLDSEETRLLSRKEELKASDGDFDSILSQLQFECTLTPCSGETEGHGPVAEEGGDVASGRGNDEAAEGGNGCEKEKKSKASEVRRLQREIQNREESRTVVSRDDFHARLTRMAVLFDSLMAVHEKDLALASVEGSLNEIHLLKGDMVPTLDSEETRLLSRKEELKASDGDFDSILSQLQFECTLTPCSGETEGQGLVAEEGGDVASRRGNDEAAEGGNGCEVEDEGSAPRSA